ncbi:hypothetical protein KZ483_21870 [Paenibacillus sp. sptzw28]|uniref:hypothetical protein n=1 Tax=Paenibacillus sp. sptzw28 TaxID=715179 RepID=UPI001C6E403B|nr:hypothetical protein [Paenibacillus sp. sptzw28]QYR20437.1 hypothetical protein KZ483_21870 [Paenibacillus sp. sptzw28]
MTENETDRLNPEPGFTTEPFAGQEPPRPQSKLGIASFIIGLVSIIGFIICIIIATSSIMNYIDGNGKTIQNIEEISSNIPLLAAGLLMLVCVGLSFVGLILGIVGACMKNTRKAFSIIGIVLNSLLTVGFIGLFIFGIIMQTAAG